MSEYYDLIVKGGILATPSGIAPADVAVRGGRVAAIGDLAGAEAAEVLDATGLHVLPGAIPAVQAAAADRCATSLDPVTCSAVLVPEPSSRSQCSRSAASARAAVNSSRATVETHTHQL